MNYSSAAFLSLLILSSTASAGLFRWVDDDGKVHYSDSVPPSKAQKGHTELDALGNQVDKVSPAKSKEQVAEEKWLSGLEEKLALKQKQQRRKDSLLLNSYASIEQFDAFYAERFKVLSDERKQLELLRGKLEQELERLLMQYKEAKNRATKKRVQGFIDINMENTQAYQDAIKQNTNEEKGIRREAEELRKRFLHLQQKKAQAKADSGS